MRGVSKWLNCLVGLGRVELPTSPLSGVRSSHLSYRPGPPTTSYLWWSWSGSNRRPPECKSGALPAELQPPKNHPRPIGRKDREDQPHGHLLELAELLQRSGTGFAILRRRLEWNGCQRVLCR